MPEETTNKGISIYTAIPAWLYDRILKEAKKERRSLSMQIAILLAKNYRKPKESNQ